MSRHQVCVVHQAVLAAFHPPFRLTLVKRVIPLAFSVSVLALAGWLPQAHAQAAASQPQQSTATARRYDIPSGPLSTVLARFANESGVLIAGAGALAQGKSSPGVSGVLSVPAALEALLVGTGLGAVRDARGQYRLQSETATVSTLAPIAVLGSLDVTTEGTGSYASQGATLFKGAQSLKDIPQSVTIITRQQMDDQGLDTLDEVLANTTGVTLVKRPNGGSDFYSRGFSTNTIQYDGIPLLRSSTTGNSFAATSIYLDRVEVLRGAQGLLEGAGNPGGAINLVRKRGLAEKAFKGEGRVGSWDNYGTRLEAGGPLDEQGRVRSRVVLDYESKHSFIDTISDRNLNAYAALDIDLGSDTTVGLGLMHSNLNGSSSLYYGLLRYQDGAALDVPRSTYLGADWNNAERRETQVFLDLEHRIDSDWRLKLSSAYVEEDYEAAFIHPTGRVSVGSRTVAGVGWAYDDIGKNIGFDTNLIGRFEALGIDHDVTLGGSYSKQKRNDRWDSQSTPDIDIFNINHNMPGLGTPAFITNTRRDIVQKGLYGMLRSHLTGDLTLVLGGRVSWYEYESTARTLTSTTRSTMSEKGEFTPYVGLVYALNPEWSVYGSYADIFQPQTATDAQLQVLKPIVGTNYEIGIKGEHFGGALNTSIAVFRIDQENRAIRDDDAPMVCGAAGTGYCSRAAGKVRSEGVDLEVHGKLARGLQISAGYTYNRNKYLNDTNADLIGTPFDFDTPKHMLRVWLDWQLPGEWGKWRLGAGVNYRSKQWARTNLSGPLQGGYSIWNIRAAYQFNKNWSASLSVENLFDKHYYSFISNDYRYSYVGPPRNFLLTVRGSF